MILGFEPIKSTLIEHFCKDKLHHAILLHGKKGIGKSSFAKEFITEILETKNLNHPDLLLIEKEAEKKEITVDKIRKISAFLNQTSAISKNKFIIIDSACELNKSAGNALLKILEEPQRNNFIILISHNLSFVLPTIRSRCQIVKLPDLSLENFTEILRKNNSRFAESDVHFLSEICGNSAADAINFGSDLAKLYALFLKGIPNKKIDEEFLKKISDKNFSLSILKKILEFFFSRLLASLNKAEINFYYNEKEIFADLLHRIPAQKIFTIVDESLISLNKINKFNLDKKLTFINIFNQICYE